MNNHWKKPDHFLFVLLLPLAFLIILNWMVFLPIFIGCWVVALAYDLWEHKMRRGLR